MRVSSELTVWTIGHSTRTSEEFLALLDENGTQAIADIRSHPGSRHFPQFGQEALSESLVQHGVQYSWIQALGGRRKTRADSINTSWRNASFRGYAVWWRCHRSMVADALKARGVHVLHIMGPNKVVEHPWTAPAHIVDGRLSYVLKA